MLGIPPRTRRSTVAAVCFGLWPGIPPHRAAPGLLPGEPAALAGTSRPSQDAVDAAAAEAIDEGNADDEFAKLQAEIDADG